MRLSVLVLDYDGTIAEDDVLHPAVGAALGEARAAGLTSCSRLVASSPTCSSSWVTCVRWTPSWPRTARLWLSPSAGARLCWLFGRVVLALAFRLHVHTVPPRRNVVHTGGAPA
jgi:hypothetical protein